MGDLKSIHPHFRRYLHYLAGGVIFVTVSNLFGIFPAQLTRNALDVVAATIDTYRLFNGFGMQQDFYRLISFNILLFGVLVLVMALLKGVFMFLMRQTIIVMSRRIEYDMKNQVFDHYQQLDSTFYNRNNTGDLMNRISEDVGRVRMYTGPAIMYTINLIVMFILVIWAMVKVSPSLTIYVLMPLPILSFMVYYVHKIINERSEAVQEKLSDLSSFVQESFSGIRVLKAYARESSFRQAYSQQATGYRDHSMKLVLVNALFVPSILFLIGLSTIIAIYVGSLEVMAGRMTIGNIAEFVIYVNMLTWPVASLGWVVSLVQRAAASQHRINEFLDTRPAITGGTLNPGKFIGKIEFREVTLKYADSGVTALDRVSFVIEPGTSVGVIGRTGSGKSSLVHLLTRTFDPTSGEILIDDQPIRAYDLKFLRSRFACVPQEVFLFSDTIRENIRFGLTGDTPESRIIAAAQDAVVYENILEFPKQFDTVVGERGITLSGGQKQRVSIARALIRDPDILVLDDCLSAVDTLTEDAILHTLKHKMENRTSVLVSHRVSSVRNADRIFVLENGHIAESGSHESLLQAGGVYAGFAAMQAVDAN